MLAAAAGVTFHVWPWHVLDRRWQVQWEHQELLGRKILCTILMTRHRQFYEYTGLANFGSDTGRPREPAHPIQLGFIERQMLRHAGQLARARLLVIAAAVLQPYDDERSHLSHTHRF
jgi:hypothetical protein